MPYTLRHVDAMSARRIHHLHRSNTDFYNEVCRDDLQTQYLQSLYLFAKAKFNYTSHVCKNDLISFNILHNL